MDEKEKTPTNNLVKSNVELADGLRTRSYGRKEFAFIDINGNYIRVAEAIDEVIYT